MEELIRKNNVLFLIAASIAWFMFAAMVGWSTNPGDWHVFGRIVYGAGELIIVALSFHEFLDDFFD